MDALADAADDDFCYLTTRGRRTGAPHEIEIWFALETSTMYLLAGARTDSDWVRNLVADPAVDVRVRELGDDAESARARRLVFDKYQPRSSGSLDHWRETALPVALDLRETDRA